MLISWGLLRTGDLRKWSRCYMSDKGWNEWIGLNDRDHTLIRTLAEPRVVSGGPVVSLIWMLSLAHLGQGGVSCDTPSCSHPFHGRLIVFPHLLPRVWPSCHQASWVTEISLAIKGQGLHRSRSQAGSQEKPRKISLYPFLLREQHMSLTPPGWQRSISSLETDKPGPDPKEHLLLRLVRGLPAT